MHGLAITKITPSVGRIVTHYFPDQQHLGCLGGIRSLPNMDRWNELPEDLPNPVRRLLRPVPLLSPVVYWGGEAICVLTEPSCN